MLRQAFAIIALLVTSTACSSPAIECLPGGCDLEESESSDGDIETSTDMGDVDGEDGDGDEGTVDPGDGDGEPDDAWAPGEMWGPCPTDTVTGLPDLCYGEDLACVPADGGERNMCLPLGSCPASLPEFGASFQVGWGDACYARCETDDDCAKGMTCAVALADGATMCAWPVD